MNPFALYFSFIPICFFVLLFNVKLLKKEVRVREFGWTIFWSLMPVVNIMFSIMFLVFDLCLLVLWMLSPWEKQIDSFCSKVKKWFNPDRVMF